MKKITLMFNCLIDKLCGINETEMCERVMKENELKRDIRRREIMVYNKYCQQGENLYKKWFEKDGVEMWIKEGENGFLGSVKFIC